ncbi:MAG TPA: response regulator, partial [Geobacteraceae bacterium]|nr:response regulator [Geobacteraceae bacterium]
EGNFEFELQDDVETIDDSKIDPLQFMLEQGLNPQFLAMEGSRIIDEKRHRGDSLDDEYLPHPEPADEEAAPLQVTPDRLSETPESSVHEIVIVEDNQAVRDFLSDLLTSSGNAVFTFARSEEALITIDTLFREGRRPFVLLDLIMPRMDGSGILGGLELLELINSNFPELSVLVMSDYRNSDAERRIREAGAEFMLKPRVSELSGPDASGLFAAQIVKALDRAARGAREENPATDVNLGDELRLELGDIGEQPSSTVVPSTGISKLRGMLEELNDPALGGGVILLLLRFASEFVGRAVILLVKQAHIVGIGQFGIEAKDSSADKAVRSLRIPVDEESLFTPVFENRVSLKASPGRSVWNDYFFGRIGGNPSEIFLGPLISEGEVVAILYGDNLPDGKPLGDTDSLEIFLSQAGVAMEKALLTQRLKSRRPEVA